MVSAFVECPRRFSLRYLHHLVRGTGIDLHAGAVFARGLEVARKCIWGHKMSVDDALVEAFRAMAKEWGKFVCADDEPKRFYRVFGALEYYFTAFPPTVDHIQPIIEGGEPRVEWNFVLPIDVKHPETGEPFLYTGRFDMFGIFHGAKAIVDEKTTQQLGAQWAARWRMRSQFTGYIWGAQRSGEEVNVAVVRGIAFYKHDYGNAEAIIHRPPWHVDMWYENLLRTVNRMVQSWETGIFDYALGEACASYGGCMYQELCDTPNPDDWVGQYKVEVWNPLIRQKAVVNGTA